jgi:hypothetical protein
MKKKYVPNWWYEALIKNNYKLDDTDIKCYIYIYKYYTLIVLLYNNMWKKKQHNILLCTTFCWNSIRFHFWKLFHFFQLY